MKNLLLLLPTIILSTSVLAAPPTPITPTIIGYDVKNAMPSGTVNNWTNEYNGNIIDLGNGLQNYEGAREGLLSGTLTDGVIGHSSVTTQLFRTADNTSITVYLDDFYSISSVTLFGGSKASKISGQITEVNFSPTPEDNTNAQYTITGLPDGEFNPDGIRVNDIFEFDYPTPLVSQFTMSNFVGDWGGYYSISEIQVSAVSAVPEPATYALMLGGLGLVGFMAMRRRRTA